MLFMPVADRLADADIVVLARSLSDDLQMCISHVETRAKGFDH